MLHFLKQKPFLRDLIPDNHIDIHSHLIPGIDDGAETIEDTTMLILGLQEIGISRFITTPHVMGEVWPNTRKKILEKEITLVCDLKIPSIRKNLKAAAEYMMDIEFHRLLTKEKLLTLKDNYVLVEMSYMNPPIQLFDILDDLKDAGYQPVLAHPERYNFYHDYIDDYKKLKQAGCLFQMNMLSATGYYGEKIAKVTEVLLKEKLIDFIGSDVHHMRHMEHMHKRIVLKKYESLYSIFQNNSIFNF